MSGVKSLGGAVALVAAVSVAGPGAADQVTRSSSVPFALELTTAHRGFDGRTCWVHARAGAIPPHSPGNATARPLVVVTMQKLLLSRSDVFYGIHDTLSSDLGVRWTPPRALATLDRRSTSPGVVAVPCDFTPKWHAKTGRLLGTGATFSYSIETNDHVPHTPSVTPYSVYDPVGRTWSEWKSLEMPKEPRFEYARAGCTQRFDLPNGEILLPIYFKPRREKLSTATVLRCEFDGEVLRYVEHGDEFTLPFGRGFSEPSLTKFRGRFYLTLRNDRAGYVTSGRDGLRFAKPQVWRFDDGTELGSYNTQTHWVTHSRGLFLAYTRRGAKNDHVFRHRAPLFLAEVDPERLVVRRGAERVLVPERGARLGNFGVVDVSRDETWVIVTEWMQPSGVERYGSDGSVFVAKIRWGEPNENVEARTADSAAAGAGDR